jgi:branched-chain amino acid aminotransferase
MMPSPLTEDEMKRALFITIDANKMKYGYIRFQISRGVGLLSDKWNELESGPNCVIIPYDVFIRKELMLHAETGYTAATTTTRKIPVECLPSAVKHCNYLNNIFGAIERTKAGADIGIMLGTDGYVREGIMYTVFFVKDNIIFTPALRNILPSVTRKSIIGLAQEDGYQVIEKDNIELSSLYLADEIFICSVSKSCLSIIELDRRVIGDGQVGPISKRIRQLLFADMDREAEKYDHKNIIGV